MSGWNATLDKAFKKLKKIGVIGKSAIAGTKGMFNQLSSLFTGGYTEGKSVWLTIPGDKAEKKKHIADYEKSGHIVKGGKVMVNKMSAKDTLRLDKKTGELFRFTTDARSKTRVKNKILTGELAGEFPPLKPGEKYLIHFKRGSGKRAFFDTRTFDDADEMDRIMDTMYSKSYSNWRSHVELMNVQ